MKLKSISKISAFKPWWILSLLYNIILNCNCLLPATVTARKDSRWALWLEPLPFGNAVKKITQNLVWRHICFSLTQHLVLTACCFFTAIQQMQSSVMSSCVMQTTQILQKNSSHCHCSPPKMSITTSH